LLLKGDVLAQLLHWAFWPLTAALLYALAAGLWTDVALTGLWPYGPQCRW